MAPDIINGVGRGAAHLVNMLLKPFGAAVDGLGDGWPLIVVQSQLNFNQGHHGERRDGGFEGVVSAWRRGVDVQALGVFRTAP